MKKKYNFLKLATSVLILLFLFSTHGLTQLQLQKTATSGSPAILTGENNGEWLRWDDGVNANAVGTGQIWWTSAILFDTNDLSDYDGWYLTKILVYQYSLANDGVIKIWQGPNINNLTEYVSQTLPMKEHTWHEIVLDNPHIIDASQELVFGVEWDDFGSGWFPPGLDADSDYPGKGDLCILGTYPEPWDYLHGLGIYGDWNKAIYVEFEPAETYTVTFEITDAKTGEDIDNAVVTLDDKTNEPGDYIFYNILPGNYEYIVEAEGYITVEGEVKVVDADVTVEVEMEPEVYTVTFIVEDSKTEEPIVNATVTFDGEEYMTDNDGITEIEDVYPSVYDYTVEKEGYITVEGEVEVIDADVTVEVEMEPEVYTVTFMVEDSETKEPIANATITFDDEEYMTDNDGTAVIEDVYPSVYDYMVEKEGYVSIEGEVEVVDADVTVEVEMEPEVYTVTFMVKDSETEDPIVNATVTFDGEEYLTDNDGMAVIEDVYPGIYEYSVKKEEYFTYEGEVEVEDDITIEVSMILEHYYPLVEENKMWSCGYNIWEFFNTYWVKFESDTVINGNEYKKVMISDWTSSPTDWYVDGYIREDTLKKKIYYMNTSFEEGMIYDFDVNIGDTINIHNRNEDYWDSGCSSFDELKLIVDNIYFKEILDDKRRVVVVREIDGTLQEKWIEGIGSHAGILKSGFYTIHHTIHPFHPIRGWPPYGNYLMCYFENDSLVYKSTQNPFYQDPHYPQPLCYYISTFVEDLEQRENIITAFPNPVYGNSFTIEFNSLFEGKIFIYNICGKLIYKRQIAPPVLQTSVILSGVPDGTYFIKTQNKAGKTGSYKIIIIN